MFAVGVVGTETKRYIIRVCIKKGIHTYIPCMNSVQLG